MDAGDVTIRVVAKDENFSAFMTRARREAQALGESVKSAGHGTVSSMQAASASIRLIEGDMTRNVRAVERFITTIPGIGKALQAVFPIVGGLATVGIIARIGEEVYKLAHDLGQIRNVANESFGTLNEGARKGADSLRVANDKLEEQIANLEHKPVNNLALALDEARLRADDLATSLNKDYESVKKIIEESQKGIASKLFNGGVDQGLGSDIENRLANIRTLARQQRDALGKGDQPGADDLAAKLRAAQDEALRFADSQTTMRNGTANAGTARQAAYSKVYGDQGINFDAINQFKDLVSSQEDTADEQKRNTADQNRLKGLEQASKASAELLKSMQEGIEKQKAMYGVSVADELAYWSARILAFSRGSDQFHTVQMEQFKLQADLYKELAEGKKKYLESAKGDVEGNDMLGRGAAEFRKLEIEQLERSAKSAQAYNEEVAKGNAEQEKARTAFAETSIQMQLLQGAISQLGAAQALAAIHAHDHAAEIDLVNQKLADQIRLINSMPEDKMSGEDKASATRNAQQEAANQIAALNGGYAITQAKDKQAVASQQIGPAIRDALNEMVRDFQDMATTLKTIIPRTMDSLNEDIVKAATGRGKAGDFGRTFTQAGDSLLKSGLQSAEGKVLGMFGLGPKSTPGSSPMNPIYTIEVGGGAGAPGSYGGILGGALSHIPGVGSGPIPNFLTSLLPHFASGGDVLANRPIMVGENGPEPFVPRTAGTIFPTGSMGGGGDTHFHIDARGATDPAAVNAAVMRAAPHIVAASSHTEHQRRIRTPHGR